MPKDKPPSRVSLIRKALEEASGPLSLGEISKKLGFTEAKLRQSIGGYYEFHVARVGEKLFDLPARAFIGKNFRYSPSWEEVTKGELGAGTDITEMLDLEVPHGQPVVLRDESGEEFNLKRMRGQDRDLGFGFSGLKRWYRENNFLHGDDIIFTVASWQPRIFLIKKVLKAERDEDKIAARNRELADLMYKQLLPRIRKFEHIIFLSKLYVFVYDYQNPLPPDGLLKVLGQDSRFLVTKKLMNGAGKPMRSWTVGIKKYFFENKEDLWVEVMVLKDEFGSYGACDSCGERLIWSQEQGWRHTKDHVEWTFTYLTPAFFNFDRGEMKPLKIAQTRRPKMKPTENSVSREKHWLLQELSALAYKRFRKTFDSLKFTEEEWKNLVLPALGEGNNRKIEAVFLEVIQRALIRNPGKNLMDLQPLARELQAMDNHYPLAYGDGTYGSFFLENVVKTKKEMGFKKPENIDEFMELVLNSHKAVDEYFQLEELRHTTMDEEFREKLKKQGFNDIPGGFPEWSPVADNVISVCHHVLDWFFMAAPQSACRYIPKKAAAIAIAVAERMNSMATGYYNQHIDKQELSKFAGYVGQSSLSSNLFRTFYDILYNVEDVGMLLFDEKESPKDWKQRLKKQAPGLEI